MKPTVLHRIVQSVAEELSRRMAQRPLEVLRTACEDPGLTPPRGFKRALQRHGVNIIAEVKRASPSKGTFPETCTPQRRAGEYEAGGAACVSVVTEPNFFGGSLEMLSTVRAAIGLPVLRKDFLIHPYQIYEARCAGADAVLLIVSILDDGELTRLLEVTQALGMDALVEVFTEVELSRALAAGAGVVGVNNRDLNDFSTALERSLELASRIPADTTAVSESGIREHSQIENLRAVGYRGFLVGEYLMRQDNPREALRRLCLSDRAEETK